MADDVTPDIESKLKYECNLLQLYQMQTASPDGEAVCIFD
jgi:hypothetical protein